MDDKIKFVEDYIQWVNENRLDPPTFSPEEYAQHLRNLNNEVILDEIIKAIESGGDAKKLIDSIMVILANRIRG